MKQGCGGDVGRRDSGRDPESGAEDCGTLCLATDGGYAEERRRAHRRPGAGLSRVRRLLGERVGRRRTMPGHRALLLRSAPAHGYARHRSQHRLQLEEEKEGGEQGPHG
jgi:hypothetical protein